MKKTILSLLAVAGLLFAVSSCSKKDEKPVDQTVKITFITNLTNAAGDTVLVNGIAGQMVQNAPAVTRTGFKFAGWFTNAADANPNPTKNTAAPAFPAYDISTKPVYLDMILYARWTP